jgi:glycosyltransferase involved in cell wall biosynthesis
MSVPPRVLFLSIYPFEAASPRYRVQQYVPYLQSRGLTCDVVPFLPSPLFQTLYSSGRMSWKVGQLALASLRRGRDVLQARHYDVVFVTRGAMLFGPPMVEWLIRHVVRRPLVFDFDDAIFMPTVSPTYGRLASRLKCPGQTGRILQMSAHVLAGNSYLADYARNHNRHVTILPTVVDMDRYTLPYPRSRTDSRPVIGWIGTHATAHYLDLIAPALQDLAVRQDYILRVIGAGREIQIPGVTVENRPWRLETEVQDFQSLDIGLYPIRDEAWSLGKCAFKAIQYMAAGVPCVCSPVGMISEVVQHEVNGLLASSSEDWLHALTRLLTDSALLRQLACAGRETVAERYALHVHAPRLADVLCAAA